MNCALSGLPCVEPVVAIKGGHVFEKIRILDYLEQNNGQCPLCDDHLTPEDLIAVSLTSKQKNKIPAMNITRSISSISSDHDSFSTISCTSPTAKSSQNSIVNVDIELLRKRKKASSYLMAPEDFTLCQPPADSPYKYFGASARTVRNYLIGQLRRQRDIQMVAEDDVQMLYSFVEKMTVITIQFVDTDIQNHSQSTIAAYARSVYHLSKFQEKQVHAWCDKVAQKFPIKS